MLSFDSLESRLWRRLDDDASRRRRFGVRGLRLLLVLLRDLAKGELSLRAMGLVYTTLLSLVPLLAVSFSVLKAFEIQNQVGPMLQRWLEPLGPQGQEVSEKIIGFVSNMKVGVLGAVGVGLLFYTVLSLLQKIERAFNETWRVGQDRSFAQRFTHYLSVLIIGPVLVFSALGLTATVMNSAAVLAVGDWPVIGSLIHSAPRLLPYLLIIFAFTFTYSFVPNTRVHWRPALYGGLIAGVLWQTSGWLFTAFIASSGSYTAIYSAFATLILFMIWLYLSWLILLVGASIAFYIQHPEFVRLKPVAASNRAREETGLALLFQVVRAYYGRTPAPTLEELARMLDQPSLELEEPLKLLLAQNILAITQDEPPRYLPGTPPDVTALAEVLEALRGRSAHREAAVSELMNSLEAASRSHLGGRTLKDWVLAAGPG